MTIRVPIDQRSVRRNPEAGLDQFWQAGKAETRETKVLREPDGWRREQYVDGKLSVFETIKGKICPDAWIASYGIMQPVTELLLIQPLPPWLFEHVVTPVTCASCGWLGPHTELRTDSDEDADGNCYFSNAICPRCGAWDCCTIVLEQPTAAMLKQWEERATEK